MIDRILDLLARASAPCSLVALGLTLVKFEARGEALSVAFIIAIKLVAMPLIAAALCFWIFELDPVAAGVVILFAAMPTGANAYLFADRYQKGVNAASGSVALGTALAAPVSALIIFLLR